MRIAVFGIGYVGAVAAGCLARDGYDIVAVDPDPAKVNAILSARAPMNERGLDEIIYDAVKAGRLCATHDPAEAVTHADISLICVGTPSREDGSIDLSYVTEACADIGRALRKHKPYHTVVLRSTMLPGSAQNTCLPIIEEQARKKAGRDFGFGNNPEFLREGTAIADYYAPPKIVVGALDERSGKTIMDLYEGIEAPRVTTTIRIAEAVKYADNVWHAVKVGFANEMGNVLKAAAVDSHRVMEIFGMDEKLNISRAYLKPGFAYGGSCLPKDINALRAYARERDIATPLFDALSVTNEKQVARAIDMVRATGRKKIAILGLAFKPGTDDLRESPLVTLAGRLIHDGYDIKIYDPSLNGRTAGNLDSVMVDDPADIRQTCDVFIVGHNTNHFREILSGLPAPDTPIIDLVRIGEGMEERRNYDGICW